MMKKYRHSFYLLQHLYDTIAITIAWTVAYFIRFHALPDGEPGLEIYYLKNIPIIVAFTVFFFHRNNLYQTLRFHSWYREVFLISVANIQSTIAFVLLLYFTAPARISRAALVIYLVVGTIILVFSRVASRNMLRNLRRHGRNLRHIVLIGSGAQTVQYLDTVRRLKDAGINVKGWADDGGLAKKYGIPTISGTNVHDIVVEHNPDAIVIGYDHTTEYKTGELLSTYYDTVVPLMVLPDLSYSLIGSKLEDFEGIPIITINHPNDTFVEGYIKRSMDVILSFIGMLVLSPFLILIALLIKLTSKGPVIYKQERMSIDGSRFLMWKFRTMRVANDGSNESGWTVKNDPRVTPIGQFLRKSSIDELPQLWNVFTGSMSLVGPRPERPMYVDQFRKKIPSYMLRHKVKGGMTGWAQVNGWRGDTSIEKRLEYDLYYIRNWSLLLDLKIILLTFVKGFISRNAY